MAYDAARARTGDTLFDSSTIDLVSLAPGEDAVELVIVSDAPWTGSDEQIASLQEKIHAYVGFAADGQMAATHPEVANLPWRIVVSCAQQPDPRTADVLARTAEPVAQYGGALDVRLRS
jgi:hypothetical protein